jgi:3-phenylpropionate/trans-cinnamate dioxygenase ferredoxin reductase subunit
MESKHDYIIVGGGLAGASAIEGIRQRDQNGSILLLAREFDLPYDRPPLSKQLWFGKKTLQEIYFHTKDWYAANNVELQLGRTVAHLDPTSKGVVDDLGNCHFGRKVLLATGGVPRHLDIPGGELDNICYYRTLNNYTQIRTLAKKGASAVVIGGGFIGSEIAAALTHAEVAVTMIFPDPYLCNRVFPPALACFLQQQYRQRDIRILDGDVPASISAKDRRFVTSTRNGVQIESDIVIVGVGIQPSVALAKNGGLSVSDGIILNDRLQTSRPDIFAARDNALFPYAALGRPSRVEHWDNALVQGRHAGCNMAGANEPYLHMPYFFSDLFEFGYEAVGEIDTRLEIVADWQEENRKGVIYYLKGGRVSGVMMCDLWGRIEEARQLIRKDAQVTFSDLRGAIR